LLVLSLVASIYADQITDLPGLNEAINFTQYSGYLDVPAAVGVNHMHYWFVESMNNPAKDPLVLWFNGGPGCSSLLGFFTELGPFQVQPDLTLQLNPYTWNSIANVLFLEMPAGVGFSYSENISNYNTNDDITSDINYAFLQLWFQEFSQYQGHSLFIAGESFAGHYVPELATKILYENQQGQPFINLKGILAGNPSTNWDIEGQYYIPFLFQHALISMPDYSAAFAACGNSWFGNDSSACQSAINTIFTRMSNRINPYNVYATCIGEGPISPGYCFTQSNFGKRMPTGQNYIPCINVSATSTYLNLPSVQKAIFVEPTYWYMCSQNLNYTVNYDNMIPLYNQLVKSIDVLIYSGDVDSCVNYLGTQACALQIETTGAQEPWQAWFAGGQVAGYKMILGDNLQWLTVKGAGHMVPGYKPLEALAFFSRFISGQPI